MEQNLQCEEITMEQNLVGWFEIYVDDMPRAQKFYEAVLKVQLETLPAGPDLEMLAFPGNSKVYGAMGALVKMDGASAGKNSVLVYFSCEDCDVEGARIEGAGGKIMRGKTSIGEYGFMVLGYDTEGNMFGLHSQK